MSMQFDYLLSAHSELFTIVSTILGTGIICLVAFVIVLSFCKTVASIQKKIHSKQNSKIISSGKMPHTKTTKFSRLASPEEQSRCTNLQKLRNTAQQCETSVHQDTLAHSHNPNACKVFALDTIYVIVGTRKCFRCQKATPVIAFGLEQYFELGKTYDSYHHTGLHVVKNIWPLPPKLEAYLHKHFDYYERLNKDVGSTNHCIHCHCKQGAHYLFDDMYNPENGDGIFFDLNMSGPALAYYPIKLPHIIPLYCELDFKCGFETFIPNEKQIKPERLFWE